MKMRQSMAALAALLFAVPLGNALAQEERGDGAGQDSRLDPIVVFKDWEKKKIADIRADATKLQNKLVQVMGYVGTVPETDVRSRNRYLLNGYGGNDIQVEFVGSQPLVNTHVYLLATVKSDGVEPYLQQYNRFTMDPDKVEAWKNFDLFYAIENAFRTKMAVNFRFDPPLAMSELSKADWSESRRTTIRDIEEHLAKDGRIPIVPPDPPVTNRWKDLLAHPEWALVVILVLAVLAVAIVKIMPRRPPRRTVHEMRAETVPQVAREAPVILSNPPPVPIRDEGTVVVRQSVIEYMNPAHTQVGTPGSLEVLEGHKGGKTLFALQGETMIGRERGVYDGHFMQLAMIDPSEQMKVSKLYCKIAYKNGQFVVSNVTTSHNPVMLNNRELDSGDSEILKDGDVIFLNPCWKFAFRARKS